MSAYKPEAGEIWRHYNDERKGVLRDIEIDRVEAEFVRATGIQSGRTTRIRLAATGWIPGYYRIRGAT